MARKGTVRRLAGATMLALAAACVVLLWPAQLGGKVSFLTTVGVSMRPDIREGDFALVRSDPPYRVGEVVAYRNAALRQIALHRIIERTQDGRFRLKGDNNDFVDSYEPTQEEIVGRLWVLLPRVGSWLDWLRRPRDAALATALLSMLIGTGVRQTRRRMRRRRTGEPVPGAGLSRRGGTAGAPAPARVRWLRTAVAAGALTVLASGAATFAAGQPAMRDDVVLVPYRHVGQFHYEAPAVVAGDVLAGEAMRDGTPVYLRLASSLRLRFDYTLESEQVDRVAGSLALRAVLSDTRGWEREIPLRDRSAFDGPEADVRATLNLATLQAMIQRFQEQTGIAATNFRLRVSPTAEVEATLAGETLRDTFAPELVFNVDTHALQLDPGEHGEPLLVERADALQRDVRVPNELQLLGRAVSVEELRRGAVATALAAAAVLLVALAVLARAPSERPSERIRRRHGARILDVQRVEPRPDERVVGMSDIRDLVRISENLEAPILHLATGDLHRYLVQEGATTYVVEVDDALDLRETATVARLPVPVAAPTRSGERSAPGGLRLPPPVVEIDLSESLPPAPTGTPRPVDGGLSLPPAPPRRPR